MANTAQLKDTLRRNESNLRDAADDVKGNASEVFDDLNSKGRRLLENAQGRASEFYDMSSSWIQENRLITMVGVAALAGVLGFFIGRRAAAVKTSIESKSNTILNEARLSRQSVTRRTVLPSMPNASKYLENPLPHLKEAQKSASRIVELQKQLLSHRAELAAIHQIKRVGLATAPGVVFAVMALLFGFGWTSVALHQAGWSAIAIAIISFIFFALIAGIFTRLFIRSLELSEDHHS